MGKTLFEKIWSAHIVAKVDENIDVLYIDKHFIHEVTSPQAFAGLERKNNKVFRPKQTLATADHNVPTKDQHLPIADNLSRSQVNALTENCKNHGITLYELGHPYHGIVHVIGPELGFTLPGMTIVCGDSHTSTHGAFGNIAFGIGTSEVEQVFATQCLLQSKPKTMRINVEGKLKKGVTAKDIILYIISKISVGGATGYFVEYAGEAITRLSMEERMTVCNMSIEMGARGGLIAPDEITFAYLKDKPFAPKGDQWQQAVDYWSSLYTDNDAVLNKEFSFSAEDVEPMITYGTNPDMAIGINDPIPDKKGKDARSLQYMNLEAGAFLKNKKINWVFIGSCTNSRIEDLRAVAEVIRGRKKADHVSAFIIPGSSQVREQAKKEGIEKIFIDAGFELREPGCSACLGMNEDKVPQGEYCVSTSNRNFEGRQGPGARTILASPLTAAACAIAGKIIDVRELIN